LQQHRQSLLTGGVVYVIMHTDLKGPILNKSDEILRNLKEHGLDITILAYFPQWEGSNKNTEAGWLLPTQAAAPFRRFVLPSEEVKRLDRKNAFAHIADAIANPKGLAFRVAIDGDQLAFTNAEAVRQVTVYPNDTLEIRNGTRRWKLRFGEINWPKEERPEGDALDVHISAQKV
jgi:hypothetical protein